MLRKVFTAGIMMMAIFSMTVVVSPASAATLNNGDLVMLSKVANPSGTVFYFNDGKLYTFPHEAVYKTWFSDWSGIKTITSAELNAYSRAGNVTVRPGTKLLKTPTTNDVYAVEPNGALRSIVSEANAIALWGANWNKNVIDQQDSVVWGTYTTGTALTVGKYPIGSIVNPKGTMEIYYYDGTNYRKFTNEATLLQNKYTFDNIVTTDMAITAGGTEITGVESALVTVSGAAVATTPGTTNPNAGSGLTVALSASTPASAVLPDGAMGVVMTKINLTASADGPVTIKNLTTHRTGVGTPSNISKVYLYEGAKSLSSTGKTVNSTTNDSLFTNLDYVIPAGTTKTIDIVAEIAASAADNHALGIAAAASITTDGATVSGSFPINGNVMSISNVSTGTATVARAGSATYTRKIGEKNQIVAKFTVTTTNEDSKFQRLSIYNSQSDILDNMTLWRGGVKLATATENGRYFDFALDTPNAILKGEAITYTLQADVYSDNVSDYAYLYLKNNSDLIIVGDTYGYGVTTDITGYDATTADEYTKIQLEAGDITMVSSGPSATDVAVDTNDITLMNLSITALNAARIEAFGFDLTNSGTIATDFENVEFYCDGIGLISSTGTTDGDETWTDEFDLEAGKTYECLLRADSTTTAGDGETIYATLDITDWSFRDVNTDTAYASTSTSYNVVPTADQVGYSMTMRTAGLTVAAATTPASQTWVRGGQNVPFAGYVFTAGNADDVLIQDITLTSCEDTGNTSLDCGSAAGNGAASSILSVKLYDGTEQIGTSKSIDSSGQIAFTDLNWIIPKGASKTLTIKADLNTSLPSATAVYLTLGIEDGAVTSYYDGGNKTISGTDPAANINTGNDAADDYDASTLASAYQYIINNGTLTMDIPGTTPASDIAVTGTTGVKFSEVKLTATREDFTVSKMAFRDISSTYDDNIAKVWVKYPTNATATTTETKECSLASGVVTCAGLAMWVPNPDIAGNKKYATIEVLADMATIAAGADAADAPEFLPWLGADWEVIGRSSGSSLYEDTITIADVTGTGTNTTETLTTTLTTTATSVVATDTVVPNIVVGDIICVDLDGTSACTTDKMFVTAVSTVTMTVIRAVNGTTATGVTAADANDGILVFPSTGNMFTDVNPMNVQGTKLTVANQMSTKTGGQSSTEEVMEFSVTANATGDAKVRKGKTLTTGAEGSDDAGASAAVTDAYTTYDLDGESDGIVWSAAGDDTDYMIAFTGTAGEMDDYDRVSMWVYWNDSSAALALLKSTITVATSTTVSATDNDSDALTGSCTELAWCQIDVALSTDTDAADIYLILSIDETALQTGAVAAASGDIMAIDDVVLYNEKIQVDLSLNEDVTIPAAGSAAYLKQNGTIVADGTIGWDVTGSDSETGAIIFVPHTSYQDIEINGTDTFTVEMPTNVFTNGGTTTEQLTCTVDLGNSSSTNTDFWWYDVEGSDIVPYVGINTTDKIATTVSY